MNKLCIMCAIVLVCFSFYLGYHFGKRECSGKMRERAIIDIRNELKQRAKKNYEDYLRQHGIDTMSYRERIEWFMSNSAYE